jgi:Protein of unknown function (DUF1559)
MKRFIVFLWLFAASPLAAADPKFDAAEAAKKLAPFVDQHTFIVARLDARQLELSALLALIEPMLPIDDEAKNVARNTLKAWQNDFTKKGGREIYVVYGASDFPQQPCLLTPIAESPNERNDLGELLKMPFDDKETASAYINGFLCVGSKSGIDRLKNRKAAHREDIVEALADAADAPFRMVFAPSPESRKIFEEVAPTLPKEVGGGSIRAFTKGMKWISLSVGPAPKVEMRLVIQAIDPDAVKGINTVVEKGLDGAKGLFHSSNLQKREAFLKFHKRAVQLLTPTVDGDKLIVKHELGAIVPELVTLLKAVEPVAGGIGGSMINLKQIGLAMHNYHDSYGRLPTNIKTKDGKPLLSWRVAILPFIEQQNLYQQFKLDEPWDSEHNKKLIAQMPKTFRSPKQGLNLKDRTTYLAPLGKGLMWDDPKGVRFADITDGTSNTILIVESDDEHAIVWTKPDDIVIDKKNPAKGLIGHWNDGFPALMCDASVRFVAKDYSALWAMFTRDGGEVLPEK